MKRKREPKVPRTLYQPPPSQASAKYRVVCISMYLADLAELDAKVYQLQCAGLRRMSRSALIRLALSKLALSEVVVPDQVNQD